MSPINDVITAEIFNFWPDIGNFILMYEGDSICNEIALITPPTHGLELYSIWCIKLYSIILTYLVTDSEKGTLIIDCIYFHPD